MTRLWPVRFALATTRPGLAQPAVDTLEKVRQAGAITDKPAT